MTEGVSLYITWKLSKNRILDRSYYLVTNAILFLIRLLSSFTRNRSGNVVILSFHRLGDTVFTIPAVKEIFRYYDKGKVQILTYNECKSIYKVIINEKYIASFDKKEFKLNSRLASGKVRRILKKLQPEIIFDITGNFASAFLAAGSQAARITGMNHKYYKSVYSDYIQIRNIPDLMDRYLDIVEIVLPVDKHKKLKEFSPDFNKSDRILINPFAGWKAKEWNLNKFIRLAEELIKIHPVELICEEGQLPGFIHDELKLRNIPVIFTSTVEELIAEIKNCSLFIGNDTGPVHIANFLGKPTYVIFGPTSVEFPYIPNSYHKFIKKSLKCSPNGTQYCFTKAGLFCPAYECMNQLTFEEVKSSVIDFINELGIGGDLVS